METVVLGLLGTASLAVIGWAAKKAVDDPITFDSIRPFMLTTFAMAGMFGMGVVIGQLDSSTRAGIALGFGGLLGMLITGMLNVLANHMHQERQRRRHEDRDD
jgi:FtsH-binding integral membrane protein